MTMKIPALLIAALTLCAAGLARAEGQDWRLRIRQEADGWSASLTGSQDYGAGGAKRLRGSGNRVERARSVAPFTRLRLEGPMDVQLAQAASDALRISADDNVEPLIESRVEGDTLVLRLQPGAGFTTRHAPRVQVDSRSLQALAMNGSGDVRIERFKGDSLALTLSGSGDLRIGLLELRELAVTLHGSGDIQLAGRADTQSWALHGSGDVDARSLSGRTVKAQLHGSGDLDLGVCESLDASLAGSGDLGYAGRPQLRQSISGSGDIHRR
ncbi:MAG: head GIN domain-containing protein [Burkholderiaceae bacterium]